MHNAIAFSNLRPRSPSQVLGCRSLFCTFNAGFTCRAGIAPFVLLHAERGICVTRDASQVRRTILLESFEWTLPLYSSQSHHFGST